MYNMDISIFGLKINIEVLILIGVIYLILIGHLFCGCCRMGMKEGFDVSGNNLAAIKEKIQAKKSNLPTQTTSGTTEGFTGANTNYGESSYLNRAYSSNTNTSSWNMPNMTVVPGQPLNPAVQKFLDRKPQPVPLPKGELLMFANTPFKPECCPNTYSTGSGCACMTGDQYNYLILRGGNNVPYSEY